MLVKLVRVNPQNYHIIVEEAETGVKHDLTCPLGIFQRVQAWGVGTIMELTAQDGIVRNVVRRDPLEGRAYA